MGTVTHQQLPSQNSPLTSLNVSWFTPCFCSYHYQDDSIANPRMASSSTSSEEREIATLLQGLRDRPADNAAAEPLLPRIFSFLTQVSPTPSGQLHWFCDKASETTVGAASFLIRLYAFKGPSVQTWKQGFRNCVSSCAFCVESLECIKATSRST